jgi:class 3 adenylate cyclase/tetratricopeptide (TPR) repeat protein
MQTPVTPVASTPLAGAPNRDLASYVSRHLAERLASGGPIRDFECTEVRGAVMLTDIVGFTAYVERVTGSRPAGIEELAEAFNAYFADLVGLVYGHGGDVLTIAGDAFFSYWPADTERELADAVLRATQAGEAIQAGLAHASEPARHSFGTRVGISAGDLRVAFVGGVGGRWELIPMGGPLGEVARAEQAATAGTVVLAEPAWARVANRCAGRELEDGFVELAEVRRPLEPVPSASLTSGDPSGELLSSYVPLPVRQRQLSSDTEWLQEMRRVTVIMASLPDFDEIAEVESDLELCHVGVRAFQEVMARFEGAAKLLVDNKGAALSGAFGLPPRAHQDDALRAIQAAETLRRELQAIGLRCTLGVATGRAFCGVYGSDLRREYTLHGEVVNLAARLMQASTGEILCSEETAIETRERVTFDALDAISVKGRARPVRIHRPRDLHHSPVPKGARMVGREPERAMLSERIERLVAEGETGTVVIEGEAGLGKSRLVSEALRMARARGIKVLEAAADPVERATSYFAWRATFADLLGVAAEAPDGAGGARSLLAELRDDAELERLLPLVGSVVPVGIPDNALTAGMPGDVRADNTKIVLAAILRRATATAPALLAVEDVHWFDSNSWALLLEVIQSVPTLLVVVTTRSTTDAPRDHQRLLEQESTQVVRLTNLSSRDTRGLVAQRLGVSELPLPLARFVEDRVAGHPFFCEELVQTMREAGILEVDGETVVVGDLEGFNLPATIEGAVLSRLDRLSSGQLLCLKVASVIGRSFLSATVRHTLPLEDERASVPEHLETLTRLDLTVFESALPEPSYMFRHEITRDVAYELLTLAQRQQLHRAVAEWHEQTYSHEELGPHYALMAHHWSRADNPDKTVTYLELAGDQALRSGAFEEALQFLARAIDEQERPGIASDPVRHALCEKGLGTAHYFLGNLQESRTVLQRVIAHLDREVPIGRFRVMAALLSAIATQVAHLARPGHYQERRRSEKHLLDEAVGAYKILGQIGYLDGEPVPTLLYLTVAGLNLGEEAGPSPHLARMLIHAATACSIVGLAGPADRYAARAVRMTDESGQTEAAAYVWSIQALIHAHRGNWELAKEANQRALDRIREVGDFNLEAEVWQTRSAVHICEGNFDAAEAAWTHTRDLSKRRRNPQVLCWSLLDEVETHLGRDELDRAAAALEDALAVPTAESDGSSTIEKHFATALVRARQGRHDEAIREADAVVGMVARQRPAGFHWVDFCAGAVEVYFDVLERDAARRAPLLRKAKRGCRAVRRASRSFGNVRPRRWLLQGLLEWHRGERDKAFGAWRRAGATAARMNMPFEGARARFEIARHGGGAERAVYLDHAADTFSELGAAYMLRRVREEQR